MRSGLHSLSPESTVTSLLSSSGHLPSSISSRLQPSSLSQSFSFRDKEYSSASAALDAYITDFERSRHGNAQTGVGLDLRPSPSSSLGRTALSTLRNRDVLRERLSERELDFLSLPVSSLRHRGNRDRLSMTTDELLALPNDGSMPITHTTAFIHGVWSKSRLAHSRSPVTHTCCRSHAPTAIHPIRTFHCSRCGAGVDRANARTCTLQRDVRMTSALGAEPVLHPDWSMVSDRPTLHLPHWLSSNKAAVDCPDVHSLPDLPYPPWLHHCQTDQLESGHESASQSEHGCEDWAETREPEIHNGPASASSWVRELDQDLDLDQEDDHQQSDEERSLKSLRLQLAEHISHLASGRTGSKDPLYTDQTIQALIHKADRVLDSLQNSATASPGPETLDGADELHIRDLDLSRTHQSDLEPPPVTMEDYKQILFRLTALETELHRGRTGSRPRPRKQSGQQGAVEDAHRPQETSHAADVTRQQVEVDGGGPSLQRALLHLHRLKLLVQKPQDEQDQGRHSSTETEAGPRPDRDRGRTEAGPRPDRAGTIN